LKGTKQMQHAKERLEKALNGLKNSTLESDIAYFKGIVQYWTDVVRRYELENM